MLIPDFLLREFNKIKETIRGSSKAGLLKENIKISKKLILFKSKLCFSDNEDTQKQSFEKQLTLIVNMIHTKLQFTAERPEEFWKLRHFVNSLSQFLSIKLSTIPKLLAQNRGNQPQAEKMRKNKAQEYLNYCLLENATFRDYSAKKACGEKTVNNFVYKLGKEQVEIPSKPCCSQYFFEDWNYFGNLEQFSRVSLKEITDDPAQVIANSLSSLESHKCQTVFIGNKSNNGQGFSIAPFTMKQLKCLNLENIFSSEKERRSEGFVLENVPVFQDPRQARGGELKKNIKKFFVRIKRASNQNDQKNHKCQDFKYQIPIPKQFDKLSLYKYKSFARKNAESGNFFPYNFNVMCTFRRKKFKKIIQFIEYLDSQDEYFTFFQPYSKVLGNGSFSPLIFSFNFSEEKLKTILERVNEDDEIKYSIISEKIELKEFMNRRLLSMSSKKLHIDDNSDLSSNKEIITKLMKLDNENKIQLRNIKEAILVFSILLDLNLNCVFV